MAVSIRFIKPADLRSTVRGLAIMSVLFDQNQNCRFWSDSSIGSDLGVWRDAGGNACFFLFAPKGTVFLGCDPESPISPRVRGDGATKLSPWPGIYEELPKELGDLIASKPFGEGFELQDVTFAIWNTTKGLDWKKGKVELPKREPGGDPDGAKRLIARFREYFDHFEEEMDEEYERTFDADALFVLFSGEPVGVDELRKVNADMDLGSVRDRLKTIGVSV